MINNRQIWVTGFLATAVYLICSTVAFFYYPLAYSPFANWLSDLGNPIINPSGAFFYNLGVILTGLFLIFFCLGLEIWNTGDKKRTIQLRIAQVTGIIAFLSLIVSAFFPLGAQTLIHSISGKAHIFFVGFFLTFSAIILLRQPSTPKWLAYFGFLTAFINFIYGVFLYSVFLAEWVAIGFFIIDVLIISGYSLKQNSPHTNS
jgi:hypothetical protein